MAGRSAEKRADSKREKEQKQAFMMATFDADGETERHGVTLKKLTFLLRGWEVFIVVSGEDQSGLPVVAFDSADDLWRAFVKSLRKWFSGAYRWREDNKPHKGNGGASG